MKTLLTMKKSNILVTGPPGCGKSTLIEKVINRMEEPVTGFFTREIKERGRRVGFSINTLDGREGILAHQNIRSQFRIGKYGVNIEDIDSLAVSVIIPVQREQVIVIDEIGKMECFSALFKKTLIQVLDSPNCVIGSIALRGGPFIQGIKNRDDVTVIGITPETLDSLAEQILGSIRKLTGLAGV
jgi:nucleoside-triphosphatase THEP1